MDYPLAKALKDAGFPQEGRGWRAVDPDKIVARRDDFAYVPTLQELIEACGEDFECLRRWSTGWGAYTVTTHVTAKTASEAVAQLWLALQKKEGRD